MQCGKIFMASSQQSGYVHQVSLPISLVALHTRMSREGQRVEHRRESSHVPETWPEGQTVDSSLQSKVVTR